MQDHRTYVNEEERTVNYSFSSPQHIHILWPLRGSTKDSIYSN